MRLNINEKTVPRLHLIGTLITILLLTTLLGGYLSWQAAQDYRASITRIKAAATAEQQNRLQNEMDSAISYIDFTRSRTEAMLRHGIREQVDNAIQMVEAIYRQASAEHSEQEIKRLIVEALRDIRFFDDRGYFFIDDMDGQFILLPTAPQVEGTMGIDNRDDTGHYIMRGLIEAARLPAGEGFSNYRWYRPDNPTEMADKLAYVRYFEPFDWLIGTGDYTYEWDQLLKQEALARFRSFRFAESGYIGLIDEMGYSLLSPNDPTLEGRHFSDMPPIEREAIKSLYEHAHTGGGFIQYEFSDPGSDTTYLKTALVNTTTPWGWIMVVTMKDDEMKASLNRELAEHQASLGKQVWTLTGAVTIALIIGVAASLLFSFWSRNLFARYHADNRAFSRALQKSQERYRLIANNSNDIIWLIDLPEKTFSYISPSVMRLLGYSPDQVLMHPFDNSLTPESLIRFEHQLQQEIARVRSGDMAACNFSIELYHPCKDGKVLPTEAVLTLLLDENNQPRQLLGVSRDITERKRTEGQLHLAASVFTHAREGIMITTADGEILDVNETFTRITGFTRDEVLGQNPRLLNSGRQSQEYYRHLWQSLIKTGHWSGEVWNRRKDGEVYAEMLTISAVKDAQGNTTHFVSLFSDITDLKRHEQQLRHIAHYDALTHLPNRILLADRMHQAMAHTIRQGQLLAVVYLDLDGFKAVNDTHGHQAGDTLLIKVAGRMKEALREGDTLARLGGDEFVAVLVDLDSQETCIPILDRLLKSASRPIRLDSARVEVSASIGVTFYPKSTSEGLATDADQLLREADQAMYQAKMSGKSRYCFFDQIVSDNTTDIA
ncbi:cache domain-containing protein [Nitrincola alkalilacustris]|uniref:cache domain-containing protein n=1 Tax=Nitrincola alkalilacustris TaxID=1571224 RepID=UPI00124C1009|nr:cache domain-containing protein [Nitrincola alkalilacustris]